MAANRPDKVDPELLIGQVRARPELWDKSSEHHKELNQRSAAWREVCMALYPDYERLPRKDKHMYARMVIKKWTNIRDAWKKSIAENKNKRKHRPYIYHEHLKFLQKNLKKHKNVEEQETADAAGDPDCEAGEGGAGRPLHEDSDAVSDYTVTDERESSVRGGGKRRPAEDFQESESSMIQFMDVKSLDDHNEDNPHLCFFRGLLPILNKLNDDETLEFQIGVIRHLQKVKGKARPADDDLMGRTRIELDIKEEFDTV